MLRNDQMKNAIRKLYARKAIPGDQLNVHGPQCPFNWCQGQKNIVSDLSKEYRWDKK